MSMGNFESFFVPVLRTLKEDGMTHRRANMDAVAKAENISPEELALKTEKGTSVFRSRVHWAQAFLAQAGAISRPQRGYLQITDRGLKLLEQNPNGFKKDKFNEFADYAEAWGGRHSSSENKNVTSISEESTPEEQIESAINILESSVASMLIERIQGLNYEFLELVVLRLLEKMGYGADSDSVMHLGQSGDEGVDGVINQDKLGLQRIYVQAKRYKSDSTIGRPDIQKFLGALAGQGANGGVFITTSKFSSEARDYVSKNLTPRIVLIDGKELANLMIKYGIGVQVKKSYQVVDVDDDYFED